jgi:hypothetical protein
MPILLDLAMHLLVASRSIIVIGRILGLEFREVD